MIITTGSDGNWVAQCSECGQKARSTDHFQAGLRIQHVVDCENDPVNIHFRSARIKAEKAVDEAWERNSG